MQLLDIGLQTQTVLLLSYNRGERAALAHDIDVLWLHASIPATSAVSANLFLTNPSTSSWLMGTPNPEEYRR